MAFQPIVELATGEIWAHEALVRGVNGEGALSVLSQVDERSRYAFDQQCRMKAISLAARLRLPADGARLSINFLPNAVYEPQACIQLTLATARATGFPLDRLIFEFTEEERADPEHLGRIISSYRSMGFATAIDDFGAGYSGLTLLARFQPDIVKLDMELVRDIDREPVKRTLVRHILAACADLNIQLLAEGIETADESAALADLGATLQQGYLFAKPAFEALARPSLAAPAPAAAVAA
ncbi:MAG: EAL domain-containing protein [Caulobacteraceae bacterium]|nr:EAL domain-containing protein [Caulobacter sp.]